MHRYYGTDAFALALRACRIGAGDEVITVSHSFIATVEAIAQVYSEQLRDVVEALPSVRADGSHVFYVYVVQVPQRDQVQQYLSHQGIGSGIHYPTPIHLQPACRRYGYTRGMLPVTEAVCERILSLPMYPELTAEQVQAVIDGVRRSVG